MLGKDNILKKPLQFLVLWKLQPKPNLTEKYMTGWLINSLKMSFLKLIHPDRFFKEFSNYETSWEVNWIDESSNASYVNIS